MAKLEIRETPTEYILSFGYHPKLIEAVKRIPARRFDGANKWWVVPRVSDKYPPERNAEYYINAFRNWAVRHRYVTAVDDGKQRDDERIIALPDMQPLDGEHYMLLEPYPYQKEGVSYALQKKRLIMGDEPGLGKTLQAICTVVKAHREPQRYGESFPALVVCPASLKTNWQREFKKFAGLDSIILDNDNKDTWQLYYERKKADGEALCNVFITNYDSLKKFFVSEVKDGKLTMRSIKFDDRIKMFNSIIIDESHKCKSPRTQQSKFVEGISRGKNFVLELTGTPVVNNNTDLIQQLKILGRLDDFGGYRHFVNRYCDGINQSSCNKELNGMLWNTCYYKREKQKVLDQLPDKTRQYINVDIDNRKEYDDAEKDIIQYLIDYKGADDEKVQRTLRGSIIVTIGLLKQISARGKIKAVADFVHSVIDGGEKLILFAFLKDVVAELKKQFPSAVTVTGADNDKQKQRAVDRFQTDPNCRLIILNYKSGGTGLTLTAASRVAFIEFPWTYADCVQAEDRAHRVGQKNNVNCYYFLGNKTIDRYIYHIIQTKKNIADEVTGNETRIEENIVDLTLELFKDRLK